MRSKNPNPNTKASTQWRAAQKAAGRTPKLIWVDPGEWDQVRRLIERLKRKRTSKEPS